MLYSKIEYPHVFTMCTNPALKAPSPGNECTSNQKLPSLRGTYLPNALLQLLLRVLQRTCRYGIQFALNKSSCKKVIYLIVLHTHIYFTAKTSTTRREEQYKRPISQKSETSINSYLSQQTHDLAQPPPPYFLYPRSFNANTATHTYETAEKWARKNISTL